MNQHWHPDYEWPLLGRAQPATEGEEHAASAPAAPKFYELVRTVKASPAVDAFARRRAGQILAGHTAESDLEKGIGQIAAEAQYRLAALHEIVGRYRMNLPPMRRTDCLKLIDAAGAVLIALRERVEVEVDEDGVPSGQAQTRRGE